MCFCTFLPYHTYNITRSALHWETHSRGHEEKGLLVLDRDLTWHPPATCCYDSKEPLGEPRQKEKQGEEWVNSSSAEKKALFYPPWPLCHPWILFTPQEVFSLIDPLPHFFTLTTLWGIFLVLCFPSSFSLTPSCFLLQGKSRKMLSKHCKLIKDLNIYYMTAGDLRGREAQEWERAVERNVGSVTGSSLQSQTFPESRGRWPVLHTGVCNKKIKKTWTNDKDN